MMTENAFDALFAEYPALIAEMPEVFTSHEFILALAQRHQRLYIEALYACRDAVRPFGAAHATLAMHLKKHPELVRLGERVSSRSIFGQRTDCAQWIKLT
ncbi:MAG: hypothetical protein JXA74_06270 [Anaerolineae bacterium]|nr:hypothetical protein [Anaerolineae bacterium]